MNLSTQRSLSLKKIAVTGSSGFIGSLLCRRLEIPELRRGSRSQGRELDLDCDCLVHLAGLSGIKQCEENPELVYRVNADETLRLAETAKEAGIRRFVFASTSAVYGEAVRSLINEGHPTHPKSVYGKSKLKGEEVFVLADESFEVVVLRKSNVYGYGLSLKGRNAVDLFLERYFARKPIEITGDGAQMRDFIHVMDAVRIYAEVATAEQVKSGIYNVGGPESISILALAEKINKVGKALLGYEVPLEFKPGKEGVQWRGARYDCSKARSGLHYEPIFALEDYLKERMLMTLRERP